MTLIQQIVTIAICSAGSITTRFLPFAVFRENRETPAYIQYIGKYLPLAVFGMLVVYALKDTQVLTGNHGLPELISLVVTLALHLCKRQMLISIAGGTICYMILVQFIFV